MFGRLQINFFCQPKVLLTLTESFLHFIWQFQKFDANQLSTHSGDSVQIFSLGQYNTDAGPDFLNAKLQIDQITWYGHVEIHRKSSDWKSHQHHHDDAYNNVILHVVWEHDQEVYTQSGQRLPVFELKGRVASSLLERSNQLVNSPYPIPCENQLQHVNRLQVTSTIEQSGVARLQRKSKDVLQELDKNRGSWEETAYQFLAKNFGFKTNAEPFLRLSQVLPHKIIAKHASSVRDIEALLFGLSGLLPTASPEGYTSDLIHEYRYLSKKYGLTEKGLLKVEWKFMRMRPHNFPTVRLAQLAMILAKHPRLFHQLINFSTVNDLKKMLQLQPSAYWQQHYDFGKKSSSKNNGLGSASAEVILINTVAPLLAAYAQVVNNQQYMDKAIDLLESLKPEQNHIINRWKELGITPNDAFETQALIGLKNDFCLKKRCLSCKIGVSLINR